MNLNLRSIHSRLRKLERKGSTGSADAFFSKLSDEELWSIVEMPDDVNGDHEEGVAYFSRSLDISPKKAEVLVYGLERVEPSLARQFRHLSDEGLLEEINKPFDSYDDDDED
jgi:hypothetical protein